MDLPCIVARLMPLAPLAWKVIADLAAIAEQLRNSSDPVAKAVADKLLNPEQLPNVKAHL